MTIVVIDGHPSSESFCRAISATYAKSAGEQGHSVRILSLRDLKFELNLHGGYKSIQNLEPDLLMAQKLIKEANHIVLVMPIWWGGPPALLKGFLDRSFLPGFAFKYRPNSKWWDQYLKNKTARIIVTSDAPSWWIRFFRGDSAVKMIRDSTFDFVGIRPVRVTRLGDIKWKSEAERAKILAGVAKLGSQAR